MSMITTLRSKPNSRQGGYDIGNAGLYSKDGKQLGDLDKESLTCNYCLLLLREPHQIITCGHRYCKPCIIIIRSQRPLQCPVDKEAIRAEHIRVDRGCANEIKSLLVDCIAKRNGCQERLSLIELEEHLAVCMFIETNCVYCGTSLRKKDLEVHLTRICLKRPISCVHCKQLQPAGSLEEHLLECLDAPVACGKCDQLVPKKELDDHMKEDCVEAFVKCIFCDFEDKLPAVNQHYAERHMHRIVKLSFKPKVSKEDIPSLVDPALGSGPRSLVETDSAFGSEAHKQHGIANPQAAVGKIGLDGDSYDSFSSADTSDTSSTFSSVVRATNSLRLAPESILQIQRSEAALKEMVEDLEEKFKKQHSQLAGAIEKIQTVQESVSRHALTMEEIKLRQDILDVKTVKGVFIWKIPDIKRRYKDALDRRTLSLYSPPFHTSPHGYRMCVRAYLNGDGSGKTTHVSVFFVLMRSEHDNLLPWPFQQAVTFQLINQRDHSKSVSETFLPDLQSPSFQQPQSEMNIASGFPRFVPQSYLKNEDFIGGNAIYIKCKVDLKGLTTE